MARKARLVKRTAPYPYTDDGQLKWVFIKLFDVGWTFAVFDTFEEAKAELNGD